ncbi:MazG-like family protein [Ornithinibacillus sp. JPR2-1]|uniref:MazG-like family protein n=1 Tax=Ornithinibacillus sp. JPR2-1 TaxID=2094019 RepID=UPI0031D4E87E
MSEEQVAYSSKAIKEVAVDIAIADHVIADVKDELVRQRSLYGVQRHSNHGWLPILGEEFGEVCQALQVGSEAYKNSDADDIEKELIQTAAVAISWVASIRSKRRGGNSDAKGN